MKSISFLTAAAMTAAVISFALPAQARCNGCAVGAGVVGGLAAGAIIGSAIAGAQPAPPPVYAPAPVYVAPPAYVEEPPCRMVRERVWDGYGYRYRRVEVCD